MPMSMKRARALVGLFGGLGLFVVLATSGCGDSKGGSGNAAAALASCNSYCDAFIAKACPAPALFATAAECKMEECVDTSAASANCNNAIKTYYDCRQTQADLCEDTGCDPQAAAIFSACS
jgi:hypothetical protein